MAYPQNVHFQRCVVDGVENDVGISNDRQLADVGDFTGPTTAREGCKQIDRMFDVRAYGPGCLRIVLLDVVQPKFPGLERERIADFAGESVGSMIAEAVRDCLM